LGGVGVYLNIGWFVGSTLCIKFDFLITKWLMLYYEYDILTPMIESDVFKNSINKNQQSFKFTKKKFFYVFRVQYSLKFRRRFDT